MLIKAVVAYLLFINGIGFFSMWLDKRKAKRREWRIEEKTLFLIALLGGSPGSIWGMYQFRHKTKHASFVIGMPLIFIFQIILAIIFMIYIR